jgi:predicted nucleic acid-binding protein
VIVVDSSVALQWVLPEGASTPAEDLLGRADLIAPDVILIEVANVLGKKVRAGDMSGDEAVQRFQFVRESIPRLQPTTELVDRALRLSIELSHGAYDCAFLACAIASAAQVVSRDRPFVERATERGYGEHVRLLPDAGTGE